MIKGDIFTSPIEYAIKKTMQELKDAEGDNEKFIYESLRRSSKIWENIRIQNLQIYEMTYDQFCQQFETKKNIIFLTDDEIKSINKAMRIIKVLEED